MKVWPTSRTCRFRRNGVAPCVTQCIKAGASGGYIGDGEPLLPVQIVHGRGGAGRVMGLFPSLINI